METNPYAAPNAVVEDAIVFGRDDLEARKAGRGARLGASLLDGLILSLLLAPFIFSGYQSYSARVHGIKATSAAIPTTIWIVVGILALIFVAINCVLLHRNGQSIGKRLVGIKIVRTNGERVSLTRVIFARVLPISVIGRIPAVGPLVTLIDPLLIFGAEKRCLHDLIADTIVIDA